MTTTMGACCRCRSMWERWSGLEEEKGGLGSFQYWHMVRGSDQQWWNLGPCFCLLCQGVRPCPTVAFKTGVSDVYSPPSFFFFFFCFFFFFSFLLTEQPGAANSSNILLFLCVSICWRLQPSSLYAIDRLAICKELALSGASVHP